MFRPDDFTDSAKKGAIERQGGRCAFCGMQINTPWTGGPVQGEAHHLRPILHGGTNDVDNCVYLCWGDHKLMGHGMAPFGVDKQGGTSRSRVVLSPHDFMFWQAKSYKLASR